MGPEQGSGPARVGWAMFEALFHAADVGMALVGSDGACLRANPALGGLVGCAPEQLVGWRVATELDEAAMAAVAGGERDTCRFARMIETAGGEIVSALVSVARVTEPDGGIVLCAQVVDVSEHVRASEGEQRYRALFEAHVDGVLVADPETLEILDANATASVMYGYPRGRLVGLRVTDLGVESGEGGSGLCPVPETAEADLVARLHRCRDGSVFPVRIGLASATLNGRAVVLAIVQDASNPTNERDRVQHRATHDPLTDLPNRALLVEEADRALARADRSGATLALIAVDLDRFEPVNDELGHVIGDSVLVEIAGRLQRAVRAGDVAARVGGDEFALLLPEVRGEEEAVAIAHRVLAGVRQPISLDSGVVEVGASIGVVVDHGGSRGVERLVRDADIALTRAKRQGRGRVELFDERLPSDARHAMRALRAIG